MGRDIRAEYDAILESQKGADTDSWYKAKFNEMLATSQRSGNELVESKEEVKRARAKYQELQMEISRLRGENANCSSASPCSRPSWTPSTNPTLWRSTTRG